MDNRKRIAEKAVGFLRLFPDPRGSVGESGEYMRGVGTLEKLAASYGVKKLTKAEDQDQADILVAIDDLHAAYRDDGIEAAEIVSMKFVI